MNGSAGPVPGRAPLPAGGASGEGTARPRPVDRVPPGIVALYGAPPDPEAVRRHAARPKVEVTREVADQIRARRATGERCADIGRGLGMTPCAVLDVAAGRYQLAAEPPG